MSTYTEEAAGVCKHLTCKISEPSDFPFSEDTNLLLRELQLWNGIVFNPRARMQLCPMQIVKTEMLPAVCQLTLGS